MSDVYKRQLQSLAGLEDGGLGGLDADLLAGAGIAGHARAARKPLPLPLPRRQEAVSYTHLPEDQWILAHKQELEIALEQAAYTLAPIVDAKRFLQWYKGRCV